MSEIPTDDLKFLLSKNLDWIGAVDGKISPVLAIDTAMLGVLGALVPGVEKWTLGAAGVSLMATLLLVASVASLVAVSFPRLRGPTDSMIYFGAIANRERAEYLKEVTNADKATLREDLIVQTHRNAEIAKGKYKAIRVSMGCLYGAVPFWVGSILIMYASSQ